MPTNLRATLAAKVREIEFQFGQASFEGEEAEPIPQAIHRTALASAANLIAESPELADLEAELTALRAENERLRGDAERWRVVRHSVWRNDRMQGLWGPVISFDLRLSADSVDDSGSIQATLDSAIDAALAAKPEPEKTK